MAKKITGYIKLQIPAGAANPAPPVGPALGQKGVNIMEFCKQFNAKTQNDKGMIIPVVITVYADKSFTFITKVSPVPALIKKAAGIESGSGEPNRKKVGKLTKAQVQDIAQKKMPDLNLTGNTMFRGKKYKKIAESIDRNKAYDLAEAVQILKKSELKFDQTVEIHFNLGVDPKHSDQVVRGTVVLPHGTGRQVRVLVFCKDNNLEVAKNASSVLAV